MVRLRSHQRKRPSHGFAPGHRWLPLSKSSALCLAVNFIVVTEKGFEFVENSRVELFQTSEIGVELGAHRALRAPRLNVAAANLQILDALIGEGVLVVTDQQRSVQFRHHLLFDYMASRVFMDAEAIVSGQAVFPKAEGLGLLLAPAMGFLLRGLWAEEPRHNRFWTAVSHLLGTQDCDPVIRSVAARMAAEVPSTAEDILAFAQAIAAGDAEALAALSHVAGAVAVTLETPRGPCWRRG